MTALYALAYCREVVEVSRGGDCVRAELRQRVEWRVQTRSGHGTNRWLGLDSWSIECLNLSPVVQPFISIYIDTVRLVISSRHLSFSTNR